MLWCIRICRNHALCLNKFKMRKKVNMRNSIYSSYWNVKARSCHHLYSVSTFHSTINDEIPWIFFTLLIIKKSIFHSSFLCVWPLSTVPEWTLLIENFYILMNEIKYQCILCTWLALIVVIFSLEKWTSDENFVHHSYVPTRCVSVCWWVGGTQWQ